MAKKTISDVIRQAMKESGLSLYGLAKETGIAPQTLLRFRRGDISLRLTNVEKLVDYLGLELVKKKDA
jgi:ribosome-binding protein aMBF1 (putative translation factor)